MGQNSHQHLEYYNIATPTNNNSHRSVESVSVVSKKTKAKSNFQRVKKYLSKLGSRGNSRKNSTVSNHYSSNFSLNKQNLTNENQIGQLSNKMRSSHISMPEITNEQTYNYNRSGLTQQPGGNVMLRLFGVEYKAKKMHLSKNR